MYPESMGNTFGAPSFQPLPFEYPNQLQNRFHDHGMGGQRSFVNRAATQHLVNDDGDDVVIIGDSEEKAENQGLQRDHADEFEICGYVEIDGKKQYFIKKKYGQKGDLYSSEDAKLLHSEIFLEYLEKNLI
jgi:hypothetical protein